MRSPDTSSLLPMVARGLTYTAGGRPVVDAVDLSLSGQGISVVMGENGAGKTVLVRLLHGLLQPTAGEVSWGGRPMNQDLRRRQAMVFQTPVLLRRSVAANIDFVLESKGAERRARRQEILASAGLADKAPQPARLLSGGERQRLAVARALATEPEILFLDEPTASLDPASVLAIEAAVTAARARGVKLVFITHDIGQAKRLADDVVFMHRGRILEHTAASAFFDHPASRQAEDYLAGRIVL